MIQRDGSRDAAETEIERSVMGEELLIDRVRRRISDWGSDGEPAPVATRTNDSVAQTPAVTADPTLTDPAMQRPVDSGRPNPAGTPR